MQSTLVILPRPSEQHMTNRHWNHVTFHRVLVVSNGERHRDGVLDLDGSLVTSPLDMVGVSMWVKGEVEFLTQFRACEVVATSSIDDNFDRLPIDAGTSLEDVRALVFIFIGLGSQDPCDHKRWTCVMLTHKKFLVLFQVLPCHGFLNPCIKLFFTQVFFIAVFMDEQNFLVSTCIRLVPFASTLVAFTGEWLIIPCVFATWGLFSLRESWLEGKLGGT